MTILQGNGPRKAQQRSASGWLRGRMDVAKHKRMALGLLLLKRINQSHLQF